MAISSLGATIVAWWVATCGSPARVAGTAPAVQRLQFAPAVVDQVRCMGQRFVTEYMHHYVWRLQSPGACVLREVGVCVCVCTQSVRGFLVQRAACPGLVHTSLRCPLPLCAPNTVGNSVPCMGHAITRLPPSHDAAKVLSGAHLLSRLLPLRKHAIHVLQYQIQTVSGSAPPWPDPRLPLPVDTTPQRPHQQHAFSTCTVERSAAVCTGAIGSARSVSRAAR